MYLVLLVLLYVAVAELGFELPDTNGRFIYLKEAIEKNGGYVSPKLIMFDKAGIESGIHTKDILKQDEEIFRIPFRNCIHEKTMKKYPVKDPQLQKGVVQYYNHNADIGLAWYMGQIRSQKKHQFHKMLNLLGEELPHAAWTWEDEDLRELKGTHALEAVMYLKKQWPQEWSRIIFEDDLHWALATSFAKSITLSMKKNAAPKRVYVPMLDMLNHQPIHAYTYIQMDYKRKQVVLKAMVDYPAGEQIWLYQGKNMNALLVSKFGFFIPYNPHDYVNLNLEMSRKKKNAPLKIKITKEILKFQQVKVTEDGPTKDTLTALRILFLRQKAFDSYTISRIIDGKWSGDKKSEKRVWKYLQKSCQERLDSYPTTKLEDERILSEESHKISLRKEMSVEYRIREKSILHTCIDQAKQYGKKSKKKKKKDELRKQVTRKWKRQPQIKSVYTTRSQWELQDAEIKITMQDNPFFSIG